MTNESIDLDDIESTTRSKMPPQTKATLGNKPPLDIKEDITPDNVVSLNNTQKYQENQAKN